jgi:hypothetical protein
MIPHRPAIDGHPIADHFFLVEKPGLDVTVMAGIEESNSGDDAEGIDGITAH